MPLYLTAEQRDLRTLFLSDDRFIIPEFQRPYSWGEDEVIQLYKDLTEAFQEEREYFLGNIILARADKDKECLQVIDGQQRIVTLWILIKILSILLPSVKRLADMYSLKSWDSDEDVPKIESRVIESNDNQLIGEIFKWDEYAIRGLSKRKAKKSNLHFVAYLLYDCFSRFFSNLREEEIFKFWNYIVKNVYVLPIELGGKTIDEATSRALTIFETINNRGLELCDADIFKAKLYHMSENAGEKEIFTDAWRRLVQGCEELKVDLDDVFRYYSRIIRGEKGIVKSENSLRDFYLNDLNSPFNGNDWQNILIDLNKIVDGLEEIDRYCKQKSVVGILCRVLDSYSNRYPWSALVAYLYDKASKGIESEESELTDFLNTLIRICYIEGSTTEVRLKIFDLIARVMNHRSIQYIQTKEFDSSIVTNPKGLKKGLMLLYSFLIDPEVKDYPEVSLFPLFMQPDIVSLHGIDKKNLNSLANYAVKYNLGQKSRAKSKDLCFNSPFYSVRMLYSFVETPTCEKFKEREIDIKNTLTTYFSYK